MIRRQIEITNRLGLHARAAAKFVTLAATFDSEIHVQKNATKVNGKSIMGIMMLAAARGSQLQLEIEGTDQTAAADELCALIENRFGEDS